MSWNSLSFPFGSLLTAAKMTQVYSNFASALYQESGAPQLGGLGNISVGSGISIPGVNSMGSANVSSAYKVQGQPARQLLQRVLTWDTTSRGTQSAVYSTYTVASLTPVSSASQIYVEAMVYEYALPNATNAKLANHLCRNPNAANSLFLLTNCSNLAGALGYVSGPTGPADLSATVLFKAVDSAANLDPKQFGMRWANTNGGAVAGAVTGGYVLVEEWL